jgi:hypothetical protein
MGKGTEPRFFKGRGPNGQKTHEERLNIPGHKGNANGNHFKIPPYSHYNDYHQEQVCGEKETSYTVGGNVNYSMETSQKTKIRTATPRDIPEEM